MAAKKNLSLHDRQIAEIRRLTLETRKDLRATAALQKHNREALEQLIGSRRAESRRCR
jgi:hypothetical protein